MYSERLKRLEEAEILGRGVDIQSTSDSASKDLSEDVVTSRETTGENEVTRMSSLKKILGHLGLKTLVTYLIYTYHFRLSWLMVTPFYAASVVELVQSDKASEPTTLISCIRDGFYRLLHVPAAPKLGSSSIMFRATPSVRSIPIATSRLLPIWRLIPPVVFLNVGHYAIRSISSIVALAYWNGHDDRLEREAELDLAMKTGGLNLHRSLGPSAPHDSNMTPSDWITLAHQRQETALQAMYNRYYTDMLAAMTASLAADVIMYPVETLVLRLCVQGTRTLVDNMDTGDVVVPIVSAYDGFFDALRSALESPSGLLGLYKGFGALVAQYALQAAFIYGIRCLYEHLLYLWPPSLPSGDNLVSKYRPPSQDPPSLNTQQPHIDVRGDSALPQSPPFTSSYRWNVM